MKISSLFGQGRTVFSFEVFPPRKSSGVETVYKTLDELRGLNPDFISVTYGAGGNLADSSTRDIASLIKNDHGVETVAHFTCVNSTRDDIRTLLGQLRESNVNNILALRGDINPAHPPKDEFHYASELIEFIRSDSAYDDFGISAACYPEGHPESESPEADLRNLKTKVDAGAEHLVSQLFFENHVFYDFLDKARGMGINVPIEAGVMPFTSVSQITRMVTMCGVSLPAKFSKMAQRYEHDPDALRDAGIAYAIDQIVDLVINGVDGIHLYTMNNPFIAHRISESVASMFKRP